MVRTTMSNKIDDMEDKVATIEHRYTLLKARLVEAEERTQVLDATISDQTFQITTLMQRVSALESELKTHEHEATATGCVQQKTWDRNMLDIVKRLRRLESAAEQREIEVRTNKRTVNSGRYRQYQIQKQLEDLVKGVGKLNELVGPED